MISYKKDIYEHITDDILKESGNGVLEVAKDTLRILSFVGTDKAGDDVYRTIRPGRACKGSVIKGEELADPRNYIRIPEAKYASLFRDEELGKSMLLSYKGILICPDFSSGEGSVFLRTMSKAAGCFKPDMSSEADCLYLASLLSDMDRDLLVAYVDSRSQRGICRPFACYAAPEPLSSSRLLAGVNGTGANISDIIKKRDAELTESMGRVWDAIARDLAAAYGEEEAEMYLKAQAPESGWLMEKGDVCLMQVDPMDICVLHSSEKEEGAFRCFKISPVSCTQIIRGDVYANGSGIVFTKGVKRLCGAAGFYDYLISGTDKEGRMFIAVPESKLLLRLCMLGGYGRLEGGNEMFRNMLLDKAVREAPSRELYAYRRNVHVMQSGNTIFLCGSVTASGNSARHDYVKEFDKICSAAAAHGMALSGWTKVDGVYTVRFEVLDSILGRPFEVSCGEGLPRLTCGMEYSFSPTREKAFEVCGVFYARNGSFYFTDKDKAVCRSTRLSTHPAATLIASFFKKGSRSGDSVYASLLRAAGFQAPCGLDSVLAKSLGSDGAYANEIQDLLAVKRGEATGEGKNGILYAAVKARIRQELLEYSDEEISSWSAFDYMSFMAGLTNDGRSFGERSRLMDCIEQTMIGG